MSICQTLAFMNFICLFVCFNNLVLERSCSISDLLYLTFALENSSELLFPKSFFFVALIYSF